MRVYDYGEPCNDWLNLSGTRVNVPTKRISNNIVVGAVSLSHADSEDLIEKTNREGFVENAAFRQFHDATLFAVRQIELERNVDKDRIRRAYAKGKQKEPVLKIFLCSARKLNSGNWTANSVGTSTVSNRSFD